MTQDDDVVVPMRDGINLLADVYGHFCPGRQATHCLVFRPGAIAEFALTAIPRPHDPNAPLMLVRSKLATASTAV